MANPTEGNIVTRVEGALKVVRVSHERLTAIFKKSYNIVSEKAKIPKEIFDQTKPLQTNFLRNYEIVVKSIMLVRDELQRILPVFDGFLAETAEIEKMLGINHGKFYKDIVESKVKIKEVWYYLDQLSQFIKSPDITRYPIEHIPKQIENQIDIIKGAESSLENAHRLLLIGVGKRL